MTNKEIYQRQVWSAVKARPESSNFLRYALWIIAVHAVVYFIVLFFIK